jgi:hypothetical protein
MSSTGADAEAAALASAYEGAAEGHLAGIDDEGRLLFRADESDVAVPVAIGVTLSDDELVQAAWLGRRALVVRPGGEPARAVLVALLRERVARAARDSFPGGLNVKVDGDVVRVTAGASLELRCGKGRILMRKDGRIEVSGTHVITRSRGPVKIKGTTVEVN